MFISLFKIYICLQSKIVQVERLLIKRAEWPTRVNTRSWYWNSPSRLSRPAAAQERKWVELSGRVASDDGAVSARHFLPPWCLKHRGSRRTRFPLN